MSPKNTKYEVHPILAEVARFMPIDPATVDALAASVKAEGQHDPVVLCEGKVLDGRTRLAACLRAGIEPTVRIFEGTESEAAALVRSMTLRRDMTPTQRALAAASMGYQRPGGDRSKNDSSSLLPELRADLARRWGVGLDLVTWARRLLDAGLAGDRLVERVLAGELTLREAADELVAHGAVAARTPAEQRRQDRARERIVKRQREAEERERQPVLTTRTAPTVKQLASTATAAAPPAVKQRAAAVAVASEPVTIASPGPDAMACFDALREVAAKWPKYVALNAARKLLIEFGG